ncbi:MAG: hypothetical protein WCG85_13890, partial [Polyangia bacterium]
KRLCSANRSARAGRARPRACSARQTRRDQALSPAEAADARARGLAAADSLQGAYRRAVEDERRKENGKGSAGTGTEVDGPGNSENAPGRLIKVKLPPGQAKK